MLIIIPRSKQTERCVSKTCSRFYDETRNPFSRFTFDRKYSKTMKYDRHRYKNSIALKLSLLIITATFLLFREGAILRTLKNVALCIPFLQYTQYMCSLLLHKCLVLVPSVSRGVATTSRWISSVTVSAVVTAISVTPVVAVWSSGWISA